MPLLELGSCIRQTYEVERFIGEGAFAEVYRVKHRFLGRQALKAFKRIGMSIDDIHDMLGEAILLSHIGHPNIVRVFDANVLDTDNGPLGYFTMEHISGGSLQKFWQSHANSFVPIETTVDLIRQVCRGISLAHRETPPTVHRDIKPQNILVGYEADGLRARVSDFGLAKQVNPLTLLATTAGTISFKPPEAFLERQGDSPASDVWAIGATLYMLLTDRLPVDVSVNSKWANKQASPRPIVAPSQINPDVDHVLDAITMNALEFQVSRRYPTAQDFLDALDRWKPREFPAVPQSSDPLSQPSKIALGVPSAIDADAAQSLVKKALQAKHDGRLSVAADLIEEAFNKSPELRSKYADKAKLWRRGISM